MDRNSIKQVGSTVVQGVVVDYFNVIFTLTKPNFEDFNCREFSGRISTKDKELLSKTFAKKVIEDALKQLTPIKALC